MTNFPDSEVIEKILGGETALFEVLIRRSNAHLYKVGRCYGYKHEDVEDLMQETFISAYVSLAKFENRSSFKTWIIKIMVNGCNKKLRKASYKNEITAEKSINEKSTPMFSHDNYSNPDKTVLNRELNYVLEKVLDQIPIDYKIVFSLREISGLNVAETAEILNITESNVKVRLNRAKHLIRNKIEKVYSPEDLFDFNLIYCDKMVDKVMAAIPKPGVIKRIM